MYEKIHEAASALTLVQAILGLAVSIVVVRFLGKWTLGPGAWWKVLLTPVYLAAIMVLLFFVYGIALEVLPHVL